MHTAIPTIVAWQICVIFIWANASVFVYVFALEHGWSDLNISSVPLAQAQRMQVLVRHLVHFSDEFPGAADIHYLDALHTNWSWCSWYWSTIALFGCTTWRHKVDFQQKHLNLLELGFSFSTIEKCEKLTAIHIIGTVIQAKATPVKYLVLKFEFSPCSIDNSNVVHFRVYLLIFFP